MRKALSYLLTTVAVLLGLSAFTFLSSNGHIVAVAGRFVRDKYLAYHQQEIEGRCRGEVASGRGGGGMVGDDLCGQSEECRNVRDGKGPNDVEVR